MKIKIFLLLLIVMLGNMFLALRTSALAPSLPDFFGRFSAYPKELFIEVNIPERALFLYQIYNEQQYLVKKYPCTIGEIQYKTPEGIFLANYFRWNPGWTPPKSEWAKEMAAVEPGPDSPLGVAALTVDWNKSILIHGTNNIGKIGSMASHGCIRLHNSDISELIAYLQNNVANSLGSVIYSKYRENPTKEFVGYFYKPITVKLVYKRLHNSEDMVLHPDVYNKPLFEAPSIQASTMLDHQTVTFAGMCVAKQNSEIIGQEYVSKYPFPYRGRRDGKKFYALNIPRLHWWVERAIEPLVLEEFQS